MFRSRNWLGLPTFFSELEIEMVKIGQFHAQDLPKNYCTVMKQQMKMTTQKHKDQTERGKNVLQFWLSLHFRDLCMGLLTLNRPWHQSSTPWRAYMFQVWNQLLSTALFPHRKHTHSDSPLHWWKTPLWKYWSPSDSGMVQNVHLISTEWWEGCLGKRPGHWAFCISRELPWPPW